MTTLRDIRRNIQSVENVKQITKTMEMVAAARLHRAQAKAEQSNKYAQKLSEVLDNVSAAATEFKHPFFMKQEVKKTAVVIVSADRGLSGNYNTAVFSAADKFLQKYSFENAELILIGRKAINYYHRRKWSIHHKISNWGGKITYAQIKALAYQLIHLFLSGTYQEIWIVYTHFISILSRKVVIEKFLSLEKSEKHKETVTVDYIFEPGPQEIYDQLLPRYVNSKIQTILDEAYAAELAARAFSMRKATKNAEDLIVELTLIRNKLRQSGITREIIEITTGAEGLKSF